MGQITINRHRRSRFWAVHDGAGDLICVCVYKRGAVEVARRLAASDAPSYSCLRESPPETSREPVRDASEPPEQG